MPELVKNTLWATLETSIGQKEKESSIFIQKKKDRIDTARQESREEAGVMCSVDRLSAIMFLLS